MIAAFKTASAVDGDDEQALLADALMMIGRQPATEVGPKAADVVMT